MLSRLKKAFCIGNGVKSGLDLKGYGMAFLGY